MLSNKRSHHNEKPEETEALPFPVIIHNISRNVMHALDSDPELANF